MNHYLSVYNDDWCNYPSGQVHEIGHNLDLEHAGEGSEEYGDQTGMMGYSYSDDTTRMCYNPAKSWQLNWYLLRRIDLNLSKRGGFSGNLIGINNYEDTTSAGKFVNVKVSGTGSAEKVFVGFNLNAGINSGTKEGKNQVTVHTQTGTGESSLVAKLGATNTHTIPGFEGGKTLNIRVKSIDTSATPPFADVDIYLQGCAPGVCGPQCNACCVDSDCTEGPPCVVGTCQDGGVCFYDRSSCPTIELEWVASNFDAGLYPLGECQGDFLSFKTQGDLVCFQRSDDREVPGCTGTGSSSWDYCYHHIANYGALEFMDSAGTNLGVCQGDCDIDSDCQEGLLCYQRGNGLVPGCTGTGQDDW